MSLKKPNRQQKAIYRTFGIALLAAVLVFPPGIFADGITWDNGSGNGIYSDPGNWGCQTCLAPEYPNNGAEGLTFDVVIIPARIL